MMLHCLASWLWCKTPAGRAQAEHRRAVARLRSYCSEDVYARRPAGSVRATKSQTTGPLDSTDTPGTGSVRAPELRSAALRKAAPSRLSMLQEAASAIDELARDLRFCASERRRGSSDWWGLLKRVEDVNALLLQVLSGASRKFRYLWRRGTEGSMVKQVRTSRRPMPRVRGSSSRRVL
jgi:hypothetical protein